MEVNPDELVFIGMCTDGLFIPCEHETEERYIYQFDEKYLGVCEECHNNIKKLK